MTLQQIRYLMSIIQWGSISQAAKELYVAQSSLSTAIKDIENEYGIVIFQRNSKGVTLTQEGQEFMVDLKHILDQFDYVNEKYQNSLHEEKRFCVSSLHHICGESAFMEFIRTLGCSHYRIGFLECKTDQVLTNVESGASDIGFLYYYSDVKNIMIQELRKREMLFHHIAYGKPHIYVADNHPLAGRQTVQSAELREYPFVSYETVGTKASLFTSTTRRIHNGGQNYYVSDRATAYTILRAEKALLVGAGYRSEDPHNSDIVSIPVEDSGQIEIGWIVKRQWVLSEIATRFMELVKRKYG